MGDPGDNRKHWLYGIQSGRFLKIGITHSLAKRLASARAFNPHPLTILIRRSIPYSYARIIEKRAHQILADYSTGREWFSVDLETAKKAVDEAVIYGEERRRADLAWIEECRSKAEIREAKRRAKRPGLHSGLME